MLTIFRCGTSNASSAPYVAWRLTWKTTRVTIKCLTAHRKLLITCVIHLPSRLVNLIKMTAFQSLPKNRSFRRNGHSRDEKSSRKYEEPKSGNEPLRTFAPASLLSTLDCLPATRRQRRSAFIWVCFPSRARRSPALAYSTDVTAASEIRAISANRRHFQAQCTER